MGSKTRHSAIRGVILGLALGMAAGYALSEGMSCPSSAWACYRLAGWFSDAARALQGFVQ